MRKFYSLVLMATALLIGTNAWAENVAKNVTTGTEYETLQKAVKAASAGDEIKLIADIDCAEGVYVDKSLTIDLDGHTYQSEGATDTEANQGCSSRNFKIVGTGTVVTIKNGTMIAYAEAAENYQSKSGAATGKGTKTANGAYGTIRTEAGSTVNLENLELYNYHPWGMNVKICSSNNGSLTDLKVNPSTANIKNCVIHSEVAGCIEVAGGIANIESTQCLQHGKNLKYPYIGSAIAVSVLGRVIVNTTSFKSEGNYGVYVYSSGGLIQVESGVFKASVGAIQLSQAKDLLTNLYDGEYDGGPGKAYTSMTAEEKALAKIQGDKLTLEFVTALGGTAGDNASQIIVKDGDFDGAIGVPTGTTLNIEGGTFDNTGLTAEQLEVYLNPEVYQVVANPDGSQTVVDKTAAKTDFSNVDENSVVTVPAATNIEITDEVSVKQLSVSDGSSVTVKDGGELHINGQMGIILGSTGNLTIEAGGKVFVESGLIHNDNEDNLVIENKEGKNGILLIAPNTQMYGNDNPAATVKFISKACVTTESKEIYQRFGLPMKKNGLTSITAAGNPETRFYAFDYTANTWKGIGYINPSDGYEDQPLDLSKLNDPFEYYQMLNFVATTPAGVEYTMKGRLLGNSEPTMNILENSWKGFANSYLGQVKLSELLALIPNTVDKAIYTYDVNATYATWNPVTNLNAATMMLDPMQPFLIRNRYEAAEVEMDYERAVYNPALGIPNPASAPRRAVNTWTMVDILVSGENCNDHIVVAEGEDFSADFDNGYDASKFMNEGINMYISADEKMAIFATDNLENTYVGLQTINGGNYTIEFANVQGEELTLIDHETGARVAMVEGATYEFTANGTNDYRFEIVGRQNMPTAIENTEAVKSAKGVYTITGQYVGEMNVWNTLPAGVYVVNGEKRVK